MRVLVLDAVAGEGFAYRPGDVVEMTADEMKRLGRAVAEAPAVERAVTPESENALGRVARTFRRRRAGP